MQVNETLVLIGEIGLPILITVLVAIGVYTFSSRAMSMWEENYKRQAMREEEDWQDRKERQKASDDRERELIRISEQANIIMARNTDVVERSILIHERTIASNDAFIDTVQNLVEDVKRLTKGG